jgi:hypothetical protein
LEKRAEQVLPESDGVGEEREEAGRMGERWLKQCMHI